MRSGRENQHLVNLNFLTSSFKVLEILSLAPGLPCDLILFSTPQKKVDQVPALETAAYQAFCEEGRVLRQSMLAGTRTINSKTLYFLPAFFFKN